MTGIFGINPIGKIIADILLSRQLQGEIVFIDDNPSLLHTTPWNIPVAFNTGTWKKQVENTDRKYKMIVALGEKNLVLRKRIFDSFSTMHNLEFISLAHDQSIVAADAVVEPGNLICRGAIIGHEVVLKSNSVFWSGSVVEHNTLVGESCYIAPNTTISGFARIGNCTLLGSGAIVLPEISIGDNCLIGAGAVVTKNIPDNSVAVGNPARIIRSNILSN